MQVFDAPVLAQLPPVAVTVPFPTTFSVSVSVVPVVVPPPVNVAPTFLAAAMVSWQAVPVPEHAPLQPVNRAPPPAPP